MKPRQSVRFAKNKVEVLPFLYIVCALALLNGLMDSMRKLFSKVLYMPLKVASVGPYSGLDFMVPRIVEEKGERASFIFGHNKTVPRMKFVCELVLNNPGVSTAEHLDGDWMHIISR